MPRISGIYSRPTGIDAVANNTIDSGKYNSNVADVEADLNIPRPIVAGGTGATNAHDARANLQAEVAALQVTNYDSHVWETGSFYSLIGATSPPVAGTNLVGACVIINNDPNYIDLVARDNHTGLVYTRRKQGGVWGAWLSGNLTDSPLVLEKPATINFTDTGVLRWVIQGNESPPASHFGIYRYDDAGIFADAPLGIDRSTGIATIKNLVISGGLSVTGDIFGSNNITASGRITANGYATRAGYNGALSGNAFNLNYAAGIIDLWVDSTNFGRIWTGNSFSPTNYVAKAGDTMSGPLRVDGGIGVGILPGSLPGVGNTNGGADMSLSSGAYLALSRSGTPLFLNVDGGDTQITYYQKNGVLVGYVFVTGTTTSYATSSDGTLKEDLQPAGITAGQILNDTEIYNFKWKGTDNERAYGVIAQQAKDVYPAAFSQNEDRYFVDYSKYVPILIQEAKTLRTRIADLEARLDALDAFKAKIEAL